MRKTQHQLELKKRNKKIIELITAGKRYREVSKQFGLTYSRVRLICKRNNVVVPRQSKSSNVRSIKRNKKVIELIRKGVTYEKIAKKFHLTRQRINQIAQGYGETSNKLRAHKYYQEIEEIYRQIANGVSVEKAFEGHNINTLRRYGLRTKISYLSERNKEIVKLYKQGLSAKEIIEQGIYRIGHINRIYQIISNNNSKRFPKLVRQQKGFINEKKKILKLIVKMKSENYTQKEIAEYLNNNNFRTITNKEFTITTVGVKYLQYLRSLK